ncbi:hypothetical protein ACFQ3R_03695 [Mesonia ostreae]|uniref:Heme exporter protein D n=1 Tax=Mesonia ostreae TaxID=861110 RepID=A0ABU2KJ81_9FLAO|nr:hypothetical protein [Mesonia ostreae]MDT0294747.1 hypothetical protein [Mesonia ostreae]
MFLQTQIPNPEETGTNQQFGWYTFGDFMAANWFYITAVVLIAVLVLIYSKKMKKERQERKDEAQKKANESSANP